MNKTALTDTSPIACHPHPVAGSNQPKTMKDIKNKKCGKCSSPMITDGFGTGYAITPDGVRICYDCADKEQVADLLARDRVTVYVSGDGGSITAWSGGRLGRVSWWGDLHPCSRERRYLNVVDIHGQRWHGAGAKGMYCNLRKSKS